MVMACPSPPSAAHVPWLLSTLCESCAAQDDATRLSCTEKLRASFPLATRALYWYAAALHATGDVDAALAALQPVVDRGARDVYRRAREHIRTRSAWYMVNNRSSEVGETQQEPVQDDETDEVHRKRLRMTKDATVAETCDELWSLRVHAQVVVLYGRCLLRRRDYGRLFTLYTCWQGQQSNHVAPKGDHAGSVQSQRVNETGDMGTDVAWQHAEHTDGTLDSLDALVADTPDADAWLRVPCLATSIAALETMLARVAIFRERRDVAQHLLQDAVLHSGGCALGAWEVLCDTDIFDRAVPEALLRSERLADAIHATTRHGTHYNHVVAALNRPVTVTSACNVDHLSPSARVVLGRLGPRSVPACTTVVREMLCAIAGVDNDEVNPQPLFTGKGVTAGAATNPSADPPSGGADARPSPGPCRLLSMGYQVATTQTFGYDGKQLQRLRAPGLKKGMGTNDQSGAPAIRCLSATVRHAQDCVGRGATRQAEVMLQHVLQLAPGHTQALLVYATVLLLHKNDMRLLSLVKRLHAPEQNLKQRPHVAPWFVVGCYYLCIGHVDFARSAFLRATTCAPGCAPAWLAMGVCFSVGQDSDQALDAWRAAGAIAPSSVAPLLMIGSERLREQNPLLALSVLGRVCVHGTCLLQGQLSVAVACFFICIVVCLCSVLPNSCLRHNLWMCARRLSLFVGSPLMP